MEITAEVSLKYTATSQGKHEAGKPTACNANLSYGSWFMSGYCTSIAVPCWYPGKAIEHPSSAWAPESWLS